LRAGGGGDFFNPFRFYPVSVGVGKVVSESGQVGPVRCPPWTHTSWGGSSVREEHGASRKAGAVGPLASGPTDHWVIRLVVFVCLQMVFTCWEKHMPRLEKEMCPPLRLSRQIFLVLL